MVEGDDVDLTGLGSNLELHLVEQLGGVNGDTRVASWSWW